MRKLLILAVLVSLSGCVVYDEGPYHRHYYDGWHDRDDWRR
jgi:hypothetical protein